MSNGGTEGHKKRRLGSQDGVDMAQEETQGVQGTRNGDARVTRGTQVVTEGEGYRGLQEQDTRFTREATDDMQE